MSEESGTGTENLKSKKPKVLQEIREEIWAQVEQERAKRAEEMPNEASALKVMFSAYQRLKELGWNEASHCPKDGSEFKVIEAGSTGIFNCYYQGEWPKGRYWIAYGGDIWPSNPILFKKDA